MTKRPNSQLEDSVLHLASEPYKGYLLGVQLLHKPESLPALVGEVPSEILPSRLAVVGTKLIWDGLKDTIKNMSQAVDGTEKTTLINIAPRFKDYAQHFAGFIENYYRSQEEFVSGLNANFLQVRPAPFLDPNLFKQICEGRSDRLTASRLMGNVAVHDSLRAPYVDTLSDGLVGIQVLGVFVGRKDWPSVTHEDVS